MLGIVFPYALSFYSRRRVRLTPPHAYQNTSLLLLEYPALSVLSLTRHRYFYDSIEDSDTGKQTASKPDEMRGCSIVRREALQRSAEHYDNMQCMTLAENSSTVRFRWCKHKRTWSSLCDLRISYLSCYFEHCDGGMEGRVVCDV